MRAHFNVVKHGAMGRNLISRMKAPFYPDYLSDRLGFQMWIASMTERIPKRNGRR